MKQNPLESTFNLQVIKKNISSHSVWFFFSFRLLRVRAFSAHFYCVFWLFALTVHLLMLCCIFFLLICFNRHQKNTFLFIHRFASSEKKKFQMGGFCSYFIGNWFLTLLAEVFSLYWKNKKKKEMFHLFPNKELYRIFSINSRSKSLNN